jgi:shikimate kinase
MASVPLLTAVPTQKPMTDHRKRHLIFLTGFMASGKSTIGPILANTLGYEFADVDKLIEAQVGKSVKEIFRGEGEAFFREVERQIILNVSKLDHHVISLGGGTVVDSKNLRVIKDSGMLVYLYSSPEHLLKRLQHKTDRPVLSDTEGQRLSPEGLRDRVLQLYEVREPMYAQADIKIYTDDKKVGITVDEIVKKLAKLPKH